MRWWECWNGKYMAQYNTLFNISPLPIFAHKYSISNRHLRQVSTWTSGFTWKLPIFYIYVVSQTICKNVYKSNHVIVSLKAFHEDSIPAFQNLSSSSQHIYYYLTKWLNLISIMFLTSLSSTWVISIFSLSTMSFICMELQVKVYQMKL